MAAIVKTALAMLLCVAAVQPGKADAMAGKPESIIIGSSHILLVQLEKVETGEWTSANRRMKTRGVKLGVRVVEILKGKVSKNSVEIDVEQNEPAIPRTFAVPGVWSGKQLLPETRLLVFSQSDSHDPTVLLTEPAVREILEPEDTLVEVRFALEAENGGWPPEKVASKAKERLANPGTVFALYLYCRLEETCFDHPTAFETIMDYLESPELSTRFKGLVLAKTYSKLSLSDPAPTPFVRVLVHATFRILEQAEASSLEQQMIGVYLPNLLGIEGAGTKKATRRYFRGIFFGKKNSRKNTERFIGAGR